MGTSSIGNIGRTCSRMDSVGTLTYTNVAGLIEPPSSHSLVRARVRPSMAYNVLMDVQDVPATLREARRALRPDDQPFVTFVHLVRDRGILQSTSLTLHLFLMAPALDAGALRDTRSGTKIPSLRP